MPCGCFGKKSGKGNKNVKEESKALSSAAPPSESNGRSEEDPVKTAKRRDVVASYYGDQCALLGYRPTGSRPPSCVDSPSTPSRTPSTAPLAPSPISSSSTSGSPSSTRRGASCRAELAEKRREFFRDFVPDDERYVYRNYSNSSTSTLPTATRARQFGDVRLVRPVSQPPISSTPLMIPPPPGPHLLRPTPPTTKIDALHDQEEGIGFASASFLRELREASEEMSKRWGTNHQDVNDSPESVPSYSKVSQIEVEADASSSDPLTTAASHSEVVSSPLSSNLETDRSDLLLQDNAGSISSSPAHLSDDEQDEGVPEIPVLPSDDSGSSSQVVSATESSRQVQESPTLSSQSGKDLRQSSDCTEYSQSDVILIDGEEVHVENVDPDSVYMYEEKDTSSGDIIITGGAVSELQPILEVHSDEESLPEDLQPIAVQPKVPAREFPPIPEQQGSPISQGSPPIRLETDTSDIEHTARGESQQDSEAILEFDSPLASTKTQREGSPQFEYDKPAKISKMEESANPELLLEDEDLRLIRQSSSDVD